MGFGYAIGVFGGLLLAHAAYATMQHRGVLKILDEEFKGPPINVVVELLSGLALSLWAGLVVPSKFRSVVVESDENRMARLPDNLDFMIFNHREKVLRQLHPKSQSKPTK